MASQPLLLPQVAVDEAELRSALQSAAIPGFTGSVSVEIAMQPVNGGKYFGIVLVISRRQAHRSSGTNLEKQILPDPERRKEVERVIDELRTKLFVGPKVKAAEFHFDNGKLNKHFAME